jgi:hypothetical protein
VSVKWLVGQVVVSEVGVGQVGVGQVAVGQMVVDQVAVGQVSAIHDFWFMFGIEINLVFDVMYQI